jgi:hypothetical protein
MPVLGTREPGGNDEASYGATCIFWLFCTQEGSLFKSEQLIGVQSIDARVRTVLFGIYSNRTIVFSGNLKRNAAPVPGSPDRQPAFELKSIEKN